MNQVNDLKAISLDIGNYLNKEKEELADLDNAYDNTTNVLKQTIG